MGEKVLLSSGNHEIYRDGDTVIKVYRKGFPKSEVLPKAVRAITAVRAARAAIEWVDRFISVRFNIFDPLRGYHPIDK